MSDPSALPSELTIYTVGELRPRGLAWLTTAREQAATGGTHADTFEVDAAAVDEVDAAGVQLLLALSHALAQTHCQLRLLRPSQALVNACQALGAGALLAVADPDAGDPASDTAQVAKNALAGAPA